MSKQEPGDSYSPEEAQQRFMALLRVALITPPQPLKDAPRQRPESKRKGRKAAKASAPSASS